LIVTLLAARGARRTSGLLAKSSTSKKGRPPVPEQAIEKPSSPKRTQALMATTNGPHTGAGRREIEAEREQLRRAVETLRDEIG
jgi:hypothetical protein